MAAVRPSAGVAGRLKTLYTSAGRGFGPLGTKLASPYDVQPSASPVSVPMRFSLAESAPSSE
jgi:hypothetical protein